MGFFQEFKAFAMRGNVVDMAVGVVIGGAFGKIVTSLVNDLISPALGLAMGGIDLKNMVVVLKDATNAAPAVTLNYGAFLSNILDFLIIAFSIFLALKLLSRFARLRLASLPGQTPPPPPQ